MACENCRTSGCDGGSSCPAEVMLALTAGRSPVFGPDGVRLPLEPAVPRPDGNEHLPAGVRGWSRGAFLLTWIWTIGNRTWVGLPALVLYVTGAVAIAAKSNHFHFWPLVVTPYLGIALTVWLGVKGRELAWRSRQWEDLDHFNRVQHKWAIAGVCFLALVIVLGTVAGLALATLYEGLKAMKG